MANLHGQPDLIKEIQSISGDLLPACLLTSPGVTAPGSGLTLAAASCTAYARSGVDLVYIDQGAVSVTVPNVAGSHWLIAHRDTYSAVAGFTRRAGSHFLTQQAATQPTIPDGAVLIAQLTVAGGNITAVDTTPALSPPLSRQTADAVAITDGRISLGGHAPTGVLDVQGSVVASDTANTYMGLRLWPVAPTNSISMIPVQIQPATGDATGTSDFRGVNIANQPVTTGTARALELSMAAGTNRYNIAAVGTAQNYFAGNVGCGQAAPSYPLDVTGQVRVLGKIGVGLAPGVEQLKVTYDRATQSGIAVHPNADSGPGAAIYFTNTNLGTIVGTITTTAAATAYNTSSDARLKHSIAPLTDSLAVIAALNPVSHRWNVDDSPGEGFLAHELQRHCPLAVSGQPDEVNDDGSIRPQQVDNSKMLPRVVGAVKELLAKVEALTVRVTTLEEALGL